MRVCLIVMLAVFCGNAYCDCFPVTGSKILGSDLALADPKLSALPASTVIGYAPVPGAKRVLTGTEVQRIAKSHNVALANMSDLCFEVPLHAFNEQEALEAMRHSLEDGVELRIVELAKYSIPAGEVLFPLDGLEPPASGGKGTQLWRGYVRFAETRKIQVWARVTATTSAKVLVARQDLPANTAIDPSALEAVTRRGSLAREAVVTQLEQIQRKMLRRSVKAGSPIPLALLDAAPLVKRGDAIKVEVRSGTAHLQFDAVAETSAREGDQIALRNPESGKTFRARVESSSRAVIVLSSGQRL